MYRFIIFFLCVSVLLSCYNNENTAETTPVETTSSETVVLPSRNAKRITNDSTQTPKAAEKIAEGKVVTYESCAAYAAATDYVFLDREGKRIFVRVNHFEDEKLTNPTLPENMQESGENIEGPPGANPEMVGKEFRLVYDEKKEKVLEVVLIGE